jgi:hypothetical protein
MAKRLRNKPAAPRQRSMLADVLPTDIGVKAAQGYIFAQGLSLAALHAAIAFLWYGFAVLAMDQVGAFLRRPAICAKHQGNDWRPVDRVRRPPRDNPFSGPVTSFFRKSRLTVTPTSY